jgi:hypothetical protein
VTIALEQHLDQRSALGRPAQAARTELLPDAVPGHGGALERRGIGG